MVHPFYFNLDPRGLQLSRRVATSLNWGSTPQMPTIRDEPPPRLILFLNQTLYTSTGMADALWWLSLTHSFFSQPLVNFIPLRQGLILVSELGLLNSKHHGFQPYAIRRGYSWGSKLFAITLRELKHLKILLRKILSSLIFKMGLHTCLKDGGGNPTGWHLKEPHPF
jgi:hypothetical protein